MNADTALHRALEELLGEGVLADAEPPPYTYATLRELYGSNRAIADAAGFPTAAAVTKERRARYPRGRKEVTARKAAEARRARQTFLKKLERWGKGVEPDKRSQELIADLIERKLETQDVDDFAELADLMADRGVTAGGTMTVRVSDDERERDIPETVFRPSEAFVDAVEDEDWQKAAEEFFDGLLAAYGIPRHARSWRVEEVDDLEVSLNE